MGTRSPAQIRLRGEGKSCPGQQLDRLDHARRIGNGLAGNVEGAAMGHRGEQHRHADGFLNIRKDIEALVHADAAE